MATRNGMIKKTALEEFRNLRKTGLIAIVIREGDELIGVEQTDGERELMLGTRGGMAIRFAETDVREMGRASMGVRGIDLADGDEVISLSVVHEDARVLSITSLGYGKLTDVGEYRLQSRSGKGIQATRLTDKTGDLVSLMLVEPGLDLMLMTDDGTIIRTPVDSISMVGRVSQGVRLMRISEDRKVVAVAAAEPEEDTAEDAEHVDTR